MRTVYFGTSPFAAAVLERLAGGPHRPALVVSRAGWADAITSDHLLRDLADAAPVHGGRPAVLIVGTGAMPASNKIVVSPETQPLTSQSRS